MTSPNQESTLGLDKIGQDNPGTLHEGSQLVDSLMRRIQEAMNDPRLGTEVPSRLQGLGFQSPLQKEKDPVRTLNEGSKRGFLSKDGKQATCGEPYHTLQQEQIQPQKRRDPTPRTPVDNGWSDTLVSSDIDIPP